MAPTRSWVASRGLQGVPETWWDPSSRSHPSPPETMLVFRSVFALALFSIASAMTLVPRANTNTQINSIVDVVDRTSRQTTSTINMLQANHTLNQNTLTRMFSTLENTFQNAKNQLAATAVSSGSTTTTPTDDDISITLADAYALVATALSGVKASGTVPGFATLVSNLDPILTGVLNQFNVTLPAGSILVGVMMRDANQFFIAEGFTQTSALLTTLGAEIPAN
ncbi:hypothetical protein HMN09_00385400 [Mycena chlorophos]|uniref:Uncharacterized protein n=1 Tax=Mycena chlorophos TaxID=658473 RepID=A0A8H6TL51_MYCCL|nr:hypothetical protein HMN09_00385400 [Mycena chlorophos]